MSRRRYRNAILCFTGFRQDESARSGFEDGYFRDIAPMQDDNTIAYAPRTWTTNIKHLADQLKRIGVERVALISYSHGQAAATAFARYAYELGLDIDLWIACDPVYRPTWLPRSNYTQPFAFRALLKTGKIKVPASIARTVYIRQERDKPCGHTLIPSTGKQTVDLAGVFHTYGHCEIDEAPEFWDIVKTELSGWIHPPKAIPIPEP
jgi:hypothetical protein